MRGDLNNDSSGQGDFFRTLVKLDVDKPLARIVNVLVGAGKREDFCVKYMRRSLGFVLSRSCSYLTYLLPFTLCMFCMTLTFLD